MEYEMSPRDFRFAFVSNSSVIAESVLEYAKSQGLRMEVHLATMESALPVARKLLDDGVDVILGGGGTGRLMRKQLRRPVVSIARTSIDLIKALLQAREISSDIGVTHYDSFQDGLDLLAELLNVRLRPIVFTTTQELVNGISRSIALGVGCIVGGGICVNIAKAQGCPGIVWMPGLESLQRAMEEAVNIAESLHRERARIDGTGLVAKFSMDDIIGRSLAVERMKKRALRYASSDASVLIHGETGTGKELLAHALHNESARATGPFVAINCAAMPEQLLESELFGYEEGAFTGARKGGHKGLFLLASGGTIFLDEVGDISPAMQVRLLRVLESREVRRIGGSILIPIDVRIISASMKDLAAEVRAGKFRQDLYFRLATLSLECPPLRKREGDLPLLCRHVLAKVGKAQIRIPDEALELLADYGWPGNMRELEALLRRYVLLAEGQAFDMELFCDLLEETRETALRQIPATQSDTDTTIPAAISEPELRSENDWDGTSQASSNNRAVLPLRVQSQAFEQSAIRRAIAIAHGDKNAAADLLGISANTLWRKLKEGQVSYL